MLPSLRPPSTSGYERSDSSSRLPRRSDCQGPTAQHSARMPPCVRRWLQPARSRRFASLQEMRDAACIAGRRSAPSAPIIHLDLLSSRPQHRRRNVHERAQRRTCSRPTGSHRRRTGGHREYVPGHHGSSHGSAAGTGLRDHRPLRHEVRQVHPRSHPAGHVHRHGPQPGVAVAEAQGDASVGGHHHRAGGLPGGRRPLRGHHRHLPRTDQLQGPGVSAEPERDHVQRADLVRGSATSTSAGSPATFSGPTRSWGG